MKELTRLEALWKLLYCEAILNEIAGRAGHVVVERGDEHRYASERLDDILSMYEAVLHYQPYCIICNEPVNLEMDDIEGMQCSICHQTKEGIQGTAFGLCPSRHHACDDCRDELRVKKYKSGSPEKADYILTERQADAVVGFLGGNSLLDTANKLSVTRERVRLALSGRTQKTTSDEEQLIQKGAIHKIREHIERRKREQHDR